jgi:hypothetical protein
MRWTPIAGIILLTVSAVSSANGQTPSNCETIKDAVERGNCLVGKPAKLHVRHVYKVIYIRKRVCDANGHCKTVAMTRICEASGHCKTVSRSSK